MAGLLGCVSVEIDDRRPGGKVLTESKGISWFSGPTGVRAGTRVWAYVRVIAPAGSTSCRTDKPFLESTNPLAEAGVDGAGVALITVRSDAEQITVSCRTPAGEISRTVASEKVVYSYEGQNGLKPWQRVLWLTPPLLHIDAADPLAARRWDELAIEICEPDDVPDAQLWEPGRLEDMQARDLAPK